MAQQARHATPAKWRVAKRALAPMAAMSGLAIFASSAFACTMIMGPLVLNPNSGHAGSVVVTSATGLKPFPAQYDLFFGGSCMTFTGKLLKTITPDMNGAWSNIKVTIPRHATLGSHALCGVEAYPNPGSTATTHNAFTVV